MSVLFGLIYLLIVVLILFLLIAPIGKKPKRIGAKGENRNSVLPVSKIMSLPSIPGVYLICEPGAYDSPLYIGSSGNIKDRFKSHDALKEIMRDYGNDLEITWLGMDKKEARAEEQKLIKKLKPPYNRAMIVTQD